MTQLARTCRNQAMRLVAPDVVGAMRSFVCHRTDACLGDRFGISYNSWRKIMADEPLRLSLATRLEARVRTMMARGIMSGCAETAAKGLQ